MLREDIFALSMVTTEYILYDGAVMRIMMNFLNQSGHTFYQLPEQSNLEPLIDELYSITPNQRNTIMSLYRAHIAEISRPTIATIGTPVTNNYSDQQCPASPQRAPSSSRQRQSVYSVLTQSA
jgi:hypothetical protein